MQSSKARSRRLSRATPSWVAALVLASAGWSGCSADTSTGSRPAPAASAEKAALAVPTKKPALFELGDDLRAQVQDGAEYIRGQRTKIDAEIAATGEQRTVVIYIGAPWCEPCRRFHDALRRGDLDKDLPGFVFFEFDHDKDEAMLKAMGCTSKLIPLFAVADEQGNCSATRSEGGIKGDGAVPYMTPKIRALAKY